MSICPHCNSINDADNDFCVNCGKPINATVARDAPPVHRTPAASETRFVTPAGEQVPARRSSSVGLIAGALALLIVLIGGGIFAVYYFSVPGETLPDHLGMFVRGEPKDRLDEIRKQDFANAIDAKATLMKDDTLPTVPPSPDLIFYSDGRDINLNDMRLVQLDTIKDDGSMKQLDFQAMQVEGKPEMKRLRIPSGLANGKYAFATFDTYINEGKQKLWPFQVTSSSKTDNGDALKATTVALKPKTPAQPPATNAPRTSIPQPAAPAVLPPGATLAYTKTNNVLIRSAPNMYATPRGKLGAGQPVYVFGYSGYDCFKGQCGSWAQVQTTTGAQGYILSVLLR